MPLKIAYIDDEIGLCQTFVDNFESDQVAVMTFTDSQTGVEAVTATGVDLVFLDYRFSNTNGDEVAEKIPEHIPIALVSGDVPLQASNRFLRVFGKPFDFGEIERFLLELAAQKVSFPAGG